MLTSRGWKGLQRRAEDPPPAQPTPPSDEPQPVSSTDDRVAEIEKALEQRDGRLASVRTLEVLGKLVLPAPGGGLRPNPSPDPEDLRRFHGFVGGLEARGKLLDLHCLMEVEDMRQLQSFKGFRPRGVFGPIETMETLLSAFATDAQKRAWAKPL